MGKMALGLRLGLGPHGHGTGGTPTPTPTPTPVALLASAMPNVTGTAPLTSAAGATVPWSTTLTNDTGYAISVATLIFRGWEHITAAPGYTDVGNSCTTTALIEYPIGGTPQAVTLAANGNITFASAVNTVTDAITLTTPIPSGAPYKVSGVGSPTTGQKYPSNLFGLSAVLTTELAARIRPCVGMFGDSLSMLNGLVLNQAAAGYCPTLYFGLGGTGLYMYTGTGFDRQLDLLQKSGCSYLICEHSFNDNYTGAQTPAQINTNMRALETKCTAKAIALTVTTQTPHTATVAAITATSVTSSGIVMSIVMPDASIFSVGDPVTISGATQTEYNVSRAIASVNTGTNTITLVFPGSATPTATGTIKVGTYFNQSSQAFQATFNAGDATERNTYNDTYVRGASWTGGYIEMADAVETARNSGRWKTGSMSPYLLPTITATVTQVTSNVVFKTDYAASIGDIGASWLLVFLSGLNAGLSPALSTPFQEIGTVALATTPTGGNVVIGDQISFIPNLVGAVATDGTHPDALQGERGGNAILVDKYRTYIATTLNITYGIADTPGTLFRDEFNRPEESLETSANWTRLSGTASYARVYTRALWTAASTGAPAVYLSPDMGSSDHWTEVVYRVAGSANNRIALRLTDVNNCIWFTLTNSTTVTINKLVAGANTVVATYTLANLPVSGDRFTLGVVGTTLTFQRNGIAITAATTPSTVSGVPLSTRQGFIARSRTEMCRRYATGV